MHNGEKPVSVIVPIYNADKYIEDCILSILNQTYQNLEIILVDDGSEDKSPQLCDSFAEKDTRIKVIHKKNEGVSAARNTGVDICKGEFIVFVDADDMLDLDILERAVLSFDDKSVIYQWGYVLFDEKKEILRSCLKDREYTMDELCSVVIANKKSVEGLGFFFRAVWGKLFYADIIRDNDIKFPNNLYIGEDAVFLLQYIKHIKGVRIISDKGYNYRISAGSAVSRYKKELFKQYTMQIDAITDVIHPNNAELQGAIFRFCYGAFNVLANNGRKGFIQGKINRNEQYKDAKNWLKKYGYIMKKRRSDAYEMRRLYRLQYSIIRWCPFVFLYYIAVFFEKGVYKKWFR